MVDRGIGIESGDLKRIFLPFEQVMAKGKQRGSGSGRGVGLGLGLGIAQAIVELHGGSIRVYSEGANRGSRFTVELPLTPRPEPPWTATGRGPADALTQPAIAPVRILLVEDHDDTSRALARLLRNAGHTVETAADVAQATAAFQRRPFDLVVSDLGLPDESGLVLMRRLKGHQSRRRRHLPFGLWNGGRPARLPGGGIRRAPDEAGRHGPPARRGRARHVPGGAGRGRLISSPSRNRRAPRGPPGRLSA